MSMIPNLSSETTDGIRVNVIPTYSNNDSSPKDHRYIFAYQIEIVNESNHEVKLLTRAWNIMDGIGMIRNVQGDGVLGTQPCIAPGECYSYMSGVRFQTPVGKMNGHYRVQRLEDGQEFSVQIPSFTVIVPYLRN